MKTCPNCGNKISDEALFCNNCGTNVANVTPDVTANTGAGVASDAAQVAGETISAAAGAANAAAGTSQNFQQSTNFNGQPQSFQPVPQVQPQPQQYRQYDPADHTAEFDPRDIADNKLFAVLPYFTFMFGVIVALLVKESAFTKFHAKNAIRIEIAMILSFIPAVVPVIGWLVSAVLFVILFIVQIIAIVYCLQGKAKDLPIVGNIGFLK
ncbi:MAG: zinc-ribbon domain-containing protein [Butyrivibrio sp.]|nr:zinc-ribbon domain-containing protein [Butyrivibrio sp.]